MFYLYDLETMYNCFLFTGKFEDSPDVQIFEISQRTNQRGELLSWLSYLQNARATMVGYNNLNFDYPIIHNLMQNPYTFDHSTAYSQAQNIIKSDQRGFHTIRVTERLIPQVDLLKINHFDNPAKATSLKSLQFAMRSATVEDLPFAFNTPLTYEQMDLMRAYNLHDVTETEKFFKKCKHLVQMRQELINHGVISGDVLNYSDVKIGVEYLIRKIGRNRCFVSGSKPRQSLRTEVSFKNIILEKIRFERPEFSAVLDWFREQTIYLTSTERPKLKVELAGLPFDFGVGGVHASVANRTFKTSETHVIRDIDVSGMYVAVAIANGFYPEHLGESFVTAYRQLQRDRAQHPKGTTMNAVLKLAGNGVYGNSNNSYSCFYDPKYTFSVTVNGQLQLLQLVERLSSIPGLQLIQANTDGITAYVPREMEPFFKFWCAEWEAQTGLKLEETIYSDMWIRDVNNYVARTTDGKMKRKGAYWYPSNDKDYEGVWNKDFSNLVAQKGASLCMEHGYSPEDVVRLFTNPYDFLMRYKTPGGAKLYIGEKEQLRTVRYYVSTCGEKMKKVAQDKGELGAWKRRNGLKDSEYEKIKAQIPPGTWDVRIHTKNKSKYGIRTTSVEAGKLVRQCNDIRAFSWKDIDYKYYADEIRKLLIGAP